MRRRRSPIPHHNRLTPSVAWAAELSTQTQPRMVSVVARPPSDPIYALAALGTATRTGLGRWQPLSRDRVIFDLRTAGSLIYVSTRSISDPRHPAPGNVTGWLHN